MTLYIASGQEVLKVIFTTISIVSVVPIFQWNPLWQWKPLCHRILIQDQARWKPLIIEDLQCILEMLINFTMEFHDLGTDLLKHQFALKRVWLLLLLKRTTSKRSEPSPVCPGTRANAAGRPLHSLGS